MKRLVVTVFLFAVLAGGVGLMTWWMPPSSDGQIVAERQGVFSLGRPVFAQQGSFLDKEAGFAAWTRVVGSVNLNLARQRFKTLDSDTGEYVVGEVEVNSSGVTSGPHVYLSRDGWLVAYYFRDQPAASAWHTDAIKPPSNFLLLAVRDVAAAAGVSTAAVNYYDFRYPSANKVTAIHGRAGTEVMVPLEIQVNEASMSALRGSRPSSWPPVYAAAEITIVTDSFQTFGTLARQMNYNKTYGTLESPATLALIYRQP